MVSEYDVVSLRPSWGAISIIFFVLALFSFPILRGLPIPLASKWAPLAIVLGTPGLATIGLLFGLIGWRRSLARGPARVGVFLNAVAIACVVVVLGALAFR